MEAFSTLNTSLGLKRFKEAICIYKIYNQLLTLALKKRDLEEVLEADLEKQVERATKVKMLEVGAEFVLASKVDKTHLSEN